MNDRDSIGDIRRQQYAEGTIDTTDGTPPQSFDTPAPGPLKPGGQHSQYWVLSDAERAKGFVRPVRSSYRHVGPPGPRFPIRDLTDEERERFGDAGYVKFEPYPDGETTGRLGRFWSQADLDRAGRGCGTVTTMGRALAETYAREPGFYGSTFCVACGSHLPVGEAGEFVWEATNERVGT